MRPIPESHSARTRQALLQAAGEVFASAGYRHATVREICRRASANVAAVNYHFGGKAGLYSEVVARSYEQTLKKYPPDFGLPTSATPEQRLRAYVHSFLLRIFDQGPHAVHGKLLSREMIEPSGVLDTLVQERFKPMSRQLAGIVAPLLGCGPEDPLTRACCLSVVGQVLFYHHCQPVLRRLYPEARFGLEEIEHLAGHITRFSLAAFAGMAGDGRRKPASPGSDRAAATAQKGRRRQ
jgi:AcrR family transcriptional regulator